MPKKAAWKTETPHCPTERPVESTFPVIGSGSDDDPRRPDLPEHIREFNVIEDDGDTMLVRYAVPARH